MIIVYDFRNKYRMPCVLCGLLPRRGYVRHYFSIFYVIDCRKLSLLLYIGTAAQPPLCWRSRGQRDNNIVFLSASVAVIIWYDIYMMRWVFRPIDLLLWKERHGLLNVIFFHRLCRRWPIVQLRRRPVVHCDDDNSFQLFLLQPLLPSTEPRKMAAIVRVDYGCCVRAKQQRARRGRQRRGG